MVRMSSDKVLDLSPEELPVKKDPQPRDKCAGGSSWPEYGQDEIDAVVEVLESGRVNALLHGDQTRSFEKELAEFSGCMHGVALANGTVALELALRVLGVGNGDEVIVTPRSFIASASCASMVGAVPVFADIDRDSQNLTARAIEEAVSSRTKAVVVVHLAGWPADMTSIMDVARRHGLFVVEDCAQAHGARYKGQSVGSFGEIATYSFCTDKIISTGGEGGMLVTNDQDLFEAAWTFKDHGKTRSALRKEHPLGYRWVHELLGTNWRMTEMQAAIGRKQLAKLPGWLERRRGNAEILREGLTKSGLRVPVPDMLSEPAYYRFSAFVPTEGLLPGWNRDRIMQEINALGVVCSVGSCPTLYRENAFRSPLCRPGRLAVSEELGATSLQFLVDHTMQPDDMRHQVDIVGEVMRKATE